jgi:nucleoside-diphosphate-sugar epimerase
MSKKALITGGCGFVGRNFCKHLTDKGYHVYCVDNLASSSSLSPDKWPKHLQCNVEFLELDCRLFFEQQQFLNDQYDLILHLAALVEGRLAIENNPITIAQDLSIDAQFFDWLTKLTNKPNKVVYFSSSASYPIKYQTSSIFKRKKLTESMIQFNTDIGMPDMTYGWAKLTGEYLAKLTHEKYGIDIVCYRPFSGYGSDQHETYPFPAILKRVVNKENPIEIWSDSVRDFVHIDDVVDCVMTTMNTVHNGDAINIGNGKAISFKKLVKLMCKITGHRAKINVLNDKPKGVAYRVCDSTHLNELGWKGKVSLKEGINKALREAFNVPL